MPFVVRPARADDRGAIEAITRDAGVFHEDEVPVALEVFDAAVAGDPSYVAVVAERGGRAVGWVCWGATPCTRGTYDMYWLAVDPAQHGAGIGSQLVAEMERRLSGVGRLIVVETLGGPLRSMLRNRPGLFFRDKPYYNQRGGIAVMTAWSLLLYLLWSAAQGLGPK